MHTRELAGVLPSEQGLVSVRVLSGPGAGECEGVVRTRDW